MIYLRAVQRNRGGLAGLGYTADDAARAVTPAEKGAAADFYNANLPIENLKRAARTIGPSESAIYGAQILLPWLQSLLTAQNWNSAQAKLITDQIASLNDGLARWQLRVISDGTLVHQAGLLVLAEDKAIIDQGIDQAKQNLLAQLKVFGDINVVNKFYADAAAAKAATDAVAAATDAAVKAGQTYIPPGVTLPSQFLPANVQASAAAQLKSFLTGSSSSGGTGGGTGGGTTPAGGSGSSGGSSSLPASFSLDSIPTWAWVTGAAGLALVMMSGGKHRW